MLMCHSACVEEIMYTRYALVECLSEYSHVMSYDDDGAVESFEVVYKDVRIPSNIICLKAQKGTR